MTYIKKKLNSDQRVALTILFLGIATLMVKFVIDNPNIFKAVCDYLTDAVESKEKGGKHFRDMDIIELEERMVDFENRQQYHYADYIKQIIEYKKINKV